MAIFKKKPAKVVMASPPEEQESNAELEQAEQSSKNNKLIRPQAYENIVEVPVYLSQTQINNMIIENNLMLKQLMQMANEED